ncbi:MAG: hypothetical protein U9M96_06325 [Thermodesulfobacteriota bacterium]|nr:hypothetical protein [Thermodesulfobacteriota bacterium]
MGKKNVKYDGNPDKRTIEKKLFKGTISEKVLERYLAQLPDLSDNTEEIITDIEETKET